jgi:phenylacetate-CoA ligase
MRGTSLLSLDPVSTLYSMLRHSHVGREHRVGFKNERPGRLLGHAYGDVAYYRGLFVRDEVKPHDIRTVEHLAAGSLVL